MPDSITFTYQLGATVRFRPAHRLGEPPRPWDPAPWRVVTRAWHEMEGTAPVEQYTLLLWGKDPRAAGYRTQGGVFPEQMQPWDGEDAR